MPRPVMTSPQRKTVTSPSPVAFMQVPDLSGPAPRWRARQVSPMSRARPHGTARSEAVLADLLDDHLLHALDVVDLLALQVAPQLLQGRPALGVGDVLVVAPQSVEPLAQVVDQVVVVVCNTTSLADVLQFFFRRQ